METDDSNKPLKELPFNNLYLNSGYVSGHNQWQFYVLTILVTIICYLLAPIFTSLHLFYIAFNNGIDMETIKGNVNILYDYKLSGINRNYILLALFGIFVFALAGFRFALKKFHQKTLTSVLTAYETFRFKRFWFALIVWSILILVASTIEYFLNPNNYVFNFNLGGFLVSLVLICVFMPIQSSFEEVFFRGYLLQGFSLIFKNGIVPLIITSFLFGAAHMSNPEAKEYGWGIMLTYYVFFALFMGAITLLDEGLELAIGIHVANNMMASILVSSDSSVIKTYSIFEEKTANVNSEIVIWLVCAAITFGIFWIKYRWKNFNLIIK